MTRVIVASPTVTSLLAQQRELEATIATLEEQLALAKGRHRVISENELSDHVTPDMLDEDTVTQLPDGSFVTFEQKHHCGVNAADRAAAHLWLEEKGHGALLKRYVTVSLGKDSKTTVARLKKVMESTLPHFEVQVVMPARGDNSLKAMLEYVCAEAGVNKPDVDEVTELPGPTLISWTKKQLRAGAELPSFFNVFTPTKAVMATAPEHITAWQRDGQWYFVDRDEMPHGPFETAHEAEEALTEYHRILQVHGDHGRHDPPAKGEVPCPCVNTDLQQECAVAGCSFCGGDQ